MPDPPSFLEVLRESRRLCEEARQLVAESRRQWALFSDDYSAPTVLAPLPWADKAWEAFLDDYADAVLVETLRDFRE